MSSEKKFAQQHPFHLVSPSIWPINNSVVLGSLALIAGLSIHNFKNGYIVLYLGVLILIISMFFWFRDIITEAVFLGDHTLIVQKGINLGFFLFVVSEGLFFMSIFWAYFHSALSPTVELGGQWPPVGVDPINPFELPLLNTIILLFSGSSITYSHHYLIKGIRKHAIIGAVLTIILAVLFTLFQVIEYKVSSFTIGDGVFGTCFFVGTGFHGLHVIIGTLFLIVGMWRIFAYHFSDNHHLGLEAAILYWHFVDVVWLFLYVSIYYWGS